MDEIEQLKKDINDMYKVGMFNKHETVGFMNRIVDHIIDQNKRMRNLLENALCSWDENNQ